MSKRVEIPSGTKFGKLTVMERTTDTITKSGQHRSRFHCVCECGNEVDVDATNLKNGKTRSCGCLCTGGQKGLKDLVGKTYGQLTVISRAENHITSGGISRTAWNCRCQCGREVVIPGINLYGGTESCGYCKHDEKYNGHVVQTESGAKFIDLVGLTFGRLTIVERGPDRIAPNGAKYSRWWARCACGNPELKLVDGHMVKQGHVSSCGCLSREGHWKDLTGKIYKGYKVLGLEKVTEYRKGKRIRWWRCKDEEGKEAVLPGFRLTEGTGCKPAVPKNVNRYEFFPDHVVGYTNSDESFIIDAEDYDKIKDYYWRVDKRTGYVETFIGRKRLPLHRLIMDAEEGEIIDHISHTTTDNRKKNLRKVTALQNAINRKRRADNSSGCTGVHFNKGWGRKPWWASIKVNKKVIHLGSFATFEEAVEARKAAEKKYFGEYAYDYSVSSVPAPQITPADDVSIDVTVAIDVPDPIPEFEVLPPDPVPEFEVLPPDPVPEFEVLPPDPVPEFDVLPPLPDLVPVP